MDKMKNCKTCGAQMAANAKVCPSCGASNKPPVYQRVWFWVLIVLVLVGIFGSAAGGEETSQPGSSAGQVSSGAVSSGAVSSGTTSSGTVQQTETSAFAGDCQITVNAEMGVSAIDLPQLNLAITNNAQKDISAIQFYIVPYDAYGEEVKGWTRQDELYTDTTIAAGGSNTVEFQFIEESVKTVRLYVYSVYFADGTEWGDKNATKATILSSGVEIPVSGEA